MNTGMPKGRAIRTPALGSRDPPSGVLPATRRCYVLEPDNRCPVSTCGIDSADTPAMAGQLSDAWPTLPGMGDESATAASTAGAATAEPPERPLGPSLSPSRAGDFLTCPLLYRFRVIDRLPEPPSPAAVRGTLVHAVLERLFDRAAADRTPEAARALVAPEWSRLLAAEPELATLFEDDAERGGEMRIVDYKTGGSPPEEFEARALFQMRFYALTIWRAQGQVPKLLQLIYLGNGEIVRYEPDEAGLLATERKIEALWQAIERATVNRDWRPRPGRICDWCAHQAICPAFGGTPPPIPDTPVRPDEVPELRDGASPV